MLQTSKSLLEENLKLLEGRLCWAVTGGLGTGSRVLLEIGGKLKRERPIRNASLTEECRHFQGELSLFVEDCFWRLEMKDQVICSSESDNRKGGELEENIRMLIGSQIRSAVLTSLGRGLDVEFSNDCHLRLLPNSILDDEDVDFFTVFTPKLAITVGSMTGVRIEKRS